MASINNTTNAFRSSTSDPVTFTSEVLDEALGKRQDAINAAAFETDADGNIRIKADALPADAGGGKKIWTINNWDTLVNSTNGLAYDDFEDITGLSIDDIDNMAVGDLIVLKQENAGEIVGYKTQIINDNNVFIANDIAYSLSVEYLGSWLGTFVYLNIVDLSVKVEENKRTIPHLPNNNWGYEYEDGDELYVQTGGHINDWYGVQIGDIIKGNNIDAYTVQNIYTVRPNYVTNDVKILALGTNIRPFEGFNWLYSYSIAISLSKVSFHEDRISKLDSEKGKMYDLYLSSNSWNCIEHDYHMDMFYNTLGISVDELLQIKVGDVLHIGTYDNNNNLSFDNELFRKVIEIKSNDNNDTLAAIIKTKDYKYVITTNDNNNVIFRDYDNELDGTN